MASAQSFDPNVAPGSIWQKQQTPDIGAANVLLALSADSSHDVWSVGDFVSLQFNGSSWSAIPLATLQTQSSSEASMNGVSAIFPTNVWSVGVTLEETVSGGSHLIPMIENYDGSQWSIVASPAFASGAQLNAIHAVSSTDIYAVGESNSDSQQPAPLLEHYDGTAWSVVTLPAISGTGTLRQIAALSDSDIWVIGDSGGVVPTTTLALHFDGAQWKNVPVPVPAGGKVHDLRFGQGITAIATNDIWAVGDFTPSSTLVTGTLIEHWNGKVWKIVPSANGGHSGSSNRLSGVAAISTKDVWACGQTFDTTTAAFENLIEHWDGTRWTLSQVALGNGFAGLNAMVAFPTGSVYAAGSDINNSSDLVSVIFHTNAGK